MLTLITGVPGSGKTAAAVDLLVRQYSGRLLYSDGLDGLTLEHVPFDVLKWPAEVPDGAIVVVDEVQRKWRPRGPGTKVPPSVSELETHRHRGLDFLLITQSPRLLDSNVRALVGRHVHIRDTGFLGRWWYEWPECNVDLSWQKCQNKRRYKLPRKVFDLYKSASMHVKPVRNRPFLMYVAAALVVGFALAGYKVWGSVGGVVKGDEVASKSAAAKVLAVADAPVVAPVAGGLTAAMYEPRFRDRPESAPLYDGLRQVVEVPHVVGCMQTAKDCKCFTDQATDAGYSADSCRAWLQSPPFSPFRAIYPASRVVRSSDASGGEPVDGVAPSSTVPVPSGYSNPRADSLVPSLLPPGSPFHSAPPAGVQRPSLAPISAAVDASHAQGD